MLYEVFAKSILNSIRDNRYGMCQEEMNAWLWIYCSICSCHRRRGQDRPSEAENNGEMPQMPVNISKQKHNRSRDMSSQIGNQPASSKPRYDTFADVTHRPEINRSRDMSSQSANQPSSSMPHYDALADVTNRPESIASHLYDDLEDVRTDGNQVSKTPVLRVESGAYADISEATSGYNEHISRGFVAGNKNHFPATYLTPAPRMTAKPNRLILSV